IRDKLVTGVQTCALPIYPPWKIIAAHYNWQQWLFLLTFAIFSMLLPFSLYFAGLQYLDATRAIVTSCLEPIFAILFAASFVHERSEERRVGKECRSRLPW